ncbi:MAG: hypothetical protein ACK58T_33290, partial [Phycisphaerae bacterium]
MQRLSRRDPTLKYIYLYNKQLTDAELAELADCLLAHPDVVAHVDLVGNQLTDETGVKLARYLAASSTIESLSLGYNLIGEATYLAVAAALRVNSSLRHLFLFDNQAVDRTRIDAAFVEALRLNPDRSADSIWYLYSSSKDFKRLKQAADELGHPSLQLVLAHVC